MTFFRHKLFFAPMGLVLPILLAFGSSVPSKAAETQGDGTQMNESTVSERKVAEAKADGAKNTETKPKKPAPPPQALMQNLVLDPGKRIEAAICADSMNRIAAINDRIIQVFGDSGTFESQNDGDTGQLFLKPTEENGSKDLSLTLITEQGITQDLTLKPTAPSAQTLIFKSRDSGTGHKKSLGREPGEMALGEPVPGRGTEVKPTSFSPEANASYQDQLLTLLKQAVRGELPVQETGFFGNSSPARPSPEGYTLSHHQSYAADPYVVDVFYAKNATPTAIETQEKTFYQGGDLALSLQRRILPPGDQALLYVVRVREQADQEGWKTHG